MRKSFSNLLPHPSTMREWLKSVDYQPGISKEALETVSRLITNAQANGKKLYFNLTCDEMAIMKHTQWNGRSQKFEGFVDLGKGEFEGSDNAPEATQSLVFMLVCISGRFKIPIAYYLVFSLSGKDRSTLLKEIMDECYLHGIDVRNSTFDGASSNISMAEEFVAEIYDNTSAALFENPHTKNAVYTTLDGCHML